MRILPEPQLNIPLGLFITGAVILQSPSCLYRGYTLHLARELRELTKQIARFIDYWRATTPHGAYACGNGGRGLFFLRVARQAYKRACFQSARFHCAWRGIYKKNGVRFHIARHAYKGARYEEKKARDGQTALFLEKARAVIVHR